MARDDDIGKFTLIGGTGLALSWGHRRSEDLDFAVPELNLPRDVCRTILQRLEAIGWSFTDIGDPVTRLYQENEGDDLADSQQDWLCRFKDRADSVKLTFFTEYMAEKLPVYQESRLQFGQVRIMAPDGLFILKSQLLLRRRTMRDLFDIMSFLQRGRTIEDILAAARSENRYCTYEKLRALLLPPRLSASDPGLASLVENGPGDFDAIKAALQQHIDLYEQRVAAEIVMRGEENGEDLIP